jgi:hypothetical protein
MTKSVQKIVIPLLLVLLIVVLIFQSTLPNPKDVHLEPQHTKSTHQLRIDSYCSINIPIERKEQQQLRRKNLKLVNLVITIRHGDRSSIHNLPNSTISLPPNGKKYVVPEAKAFVQHLENFQLHFLKSQSNVPEDFLEELRNALNPNKAFQQSDFTLEQGQLTTRGFMQHLELGKMIHTLYQDYLSQIQYSNQVYIRSTNYARTIQVKKKIFPY